MSTNTAVTAITVWTIACLVATAIVGPAALVALAAGWLALWAVADLA